MYSSSAATLLLRACARLHSLAQAARSLEVILSRVPAMGTAAHSGCRDFDSWCRQFLGQVHLPTLAWDERERSLGKRDRGLCERLCNARSGRVALKHVDPAEGRLKFRAFRALDE